MKALAVAAGIVFWTLVLGIAWLALFPGSGGEPVAVLEIDPSANAPVSDSGTSPEDATELPAESGNVPSPGGVSVGGPVELPPGFAVTGPETQQAPGVPPAPGTTLMPPTGVQTVPVPPPVPGPQGALPQDHQKLQMAAGGNKPAAVSISAPASAARPIPLPAPADEASVTLASVPADGLVEDTQYGPLPRIAADGRRAAEIYARPTRYVAKAGAGEPARVAVLINGLGLPDSPNGDVLKDLPAQVSVAYGAYARSLQDWVTRARAEGHEVLLEVPLEPENYPSVDPGPHTLLTTLPPEENLKRLQWLMSRYTGYVGVTNHMGAKFEASKEALLPVLEEIKARGLIYVDDGTAPQSAAGEMANVLGLDYSVANVQLDDGADLAKSLAKLEAAARQNGAAIGVAKAKPGTAKQLADWAGTLEAKGLVLVPVSAAVRLQRQS